MTYQSKAHEKLYSNMSIECSFDHSFDRQQLKMTGKWPENRFFYNCFFQGSMSTPNEIRSWFSSWILVLTYIFISWTKIGRGRPVTPPQGGNHPKNQKNTFWVMWHINRKHMKSSTQICQLNAHLTTHLTVSSWKWPENRFFITVFFRGACPHRMR